MIFFDVGIIDALCMASRAPYITHTVATMSTTSTAPKRPLALRRTLIVLVAQTLHFSGCHVSYIYKHISLS